MANCGTVQELAIVYNLLVSLRDKELLHLTTAKVEVQNLDARASIQSTLDHAIGSLSVIYLFSVLEEQGFSLSNSSFQKLSPTLIKKMKAWKHCRHCAGHGFSGVRVSGRKNSYNAEFDDVWNQDPNFRARVHFNQPSNIIRLERTAGLTCLEDLISMFGEMLNV